MANDVRIVVAQRGWVFVGYWAQDGDEVVLTRARTVRRWGTDTDGITLLTRGPTEETLKNLDTHGATLRMHRLAVICTFDCDAAAWAPTLDAGTVAR